MEIEWFMNLSSHAQGFVIAGTFFVIAITFVVGWVIRSDREESEKDKQQKGLDRQCGKMS